MKQRQVFLVLHKWYRLIKTKDAAPFWDCYMSDIVAAFETEEKADAYIVNEIERARDAWKPLPFETKAETFDDRHQWSKEGSCYVDWGDAAAVAYEIKEMEVG